MIQWLLDHRSVSAETAMLSFSTKVIQWKLKSIKRVFKELNKFEVLALSTHSSGLNLLENLWDWPWQIGLSHECPSCNPQKYNLFQTYALVCPYVGFNKSDLKITKLAELCWAWLHVSQLFSVLIQSCKASDPSKSYQTPAF